MLDKASPAERATMNFMNLASARCGSEPSSHPSAWLICLKDWKPRLHQDLKLRLPL